MYKRSYFHYQLTETPKVTYERQAVSVDVDKFSFMEQFKWLMTNGQDMPYNHPANIASKLFLLSLLMASSWILTKPIKKYYDYKDPLVRDNDDTMTGISAEATMRRLKYKKKLPNW